MLCCAARQWRSGKMSGSRSAPPRPQRHPRHRAQPPRSHGLSQRRRPGGVSGNQARHVSAERKLHSVGERFCRELRASGRGQRSTPAGRQASTRPKANRGPLASRPPYIGQEAALLHQHGSATVHCGVGSEVGASPGGAGPNPDQRGNQGRPARSEAGRSMRWQQVLRKQAGAPGWGRREAAGSGVSNL